MSRLAMYSVLSQMYDGKFLSSSAIAPLSADWTDTLSEPCLVSANGGRYTASSAPSLVTMPPVAVVSGVTSRVIGTSCSTASARPLGPTALKVIFAVPSASTLAGQPSTCDSLGRTVTVFVSGPLTATPSALSVTVADTSLRVPLRSSARSSVSSPTRSTRGSAGRRSSGWVETSSLRPSPTIESPLIARACRRHVVRLSGIRTSTNAVPSSLVTSWAAQNAVFRKSWRTCCCASPLPPLP